MIQQEQEALFPETQFSCCLPKVEEEKGSSTLTNIHLIVNLPRCSFLILSHRGVQHAGLSSCGKENAFHSGDLVSIINITHTSIYGV